MYKITIYHEETQKMTLNTKLDSRKQTWTEIDETNSQRQLMHKNTSSLRSALFLSQNNKCTQCLHCSNSTQLISLRYGRWSMLGETKQSTYAARLSVVSSQELVIVFIIRKAELGDWTRWPSDCNAAGRGPGSRLIGSTLGWSDVFCPCFVCCHLFHTFSCRYFVFTAFWPFYLGFVLSCNLMVAQHAARQQPLSQPASHAPSLLGSHREMAHTASSSQQLCHPC